MRKVLKWIGIVLGGLIGLIVLALVGVLIYGQVSFHKKVNRPVYPITADTSPEGVARGEYIVRDLVGCQGCHGPRVEEGQQPDRNAALSGHTEEIVFGPIEAGFNTLAIAAALNSAVAAFYYFRIVRVMYLVPAKNTLPVSTSFALSLALFLMLAGTIVFGLAPVPLIAFVKGVLSL